MSEYQHAKLYFNGVEVPNGAVSIEWASPVVAKMLPAPVPYEASFTCETTLRLDDWGRPLHALTPPVRGVSDHRLARRAMYGGRKGRRAFRRLLEKGYDAVAAAHGVALPVKTGDP